jgi:hypothetical protein
MDSIPVSLLLFLNHVSFNLHSHLALAHPTTRHVNKEKMRECA